MSYRLTKIYTRKGDEGFTHLRDEYISKDDLLVEAIGTLDELNSNLGVVIAHQIQNKEIEATLTRVQNDLFDMGGELHLPAHQVISAEYVTRLENQLDKWNEQLPPLKDFLLPGGNIKSATCHVARTVCRRAERALVRLHRQVSLSNPEMLRYLNRLSDLLFVAARMLGLESQEREVLWEHERGKKKE